jgi:hypothetical protein
VNKLFKTEFSDFPTGVRVKFTLGVASASPATLVGLFLITIADDHLEETLV